jgi:hypothetical protein
MKKIIPFHDYGQRIPPSDEWDYIGTVIPTFSRLALRNGWKIIEVEDEQESDRRTDNGNART